MKTISELEAEVVTLKEHEVQLWQRVQEQNRVLDALTKPWCEIGSKIRKLETMIETRKEMESAQ